MPELKSSVLSSKHYNNLHVYINIMLLFNLFGALFARVRALIKEHAFVLYWYTLIISRLRYRYRYKI